MKAESLNVDLGNDERNLILNWSIHIECSHRRIDKSEPHVLVTVSSLTIIYFTATPHAEHLTLINAQRANIQSMLHASYEHRYRIIDIYT